MVVKVIDASALCAILFNELEAEAVTDLIGDADLVAPALLGFELINVCCTKMRRHPDRRPVLTASFAMRHRFGVRERAVDPDAVVQLAIATGLTGYDANYLWLSRHLGAELITLDRQLARAFAT